MQLALEDFMTKQKEIDEKLVAMEVSQSGLEDQLAEECKKRKSAEHKLKSVQQKLDYANQERFGDRRKK